MPWRARPFARQNARVRVTLLTIALLTLAVSGGAHPAAAQDASDGAELQTAVLDLRIDTLDAAHARQVIENLHTAGVRADLLPW